MTQADKLIDEIFTEIDSMTRDDILSLKKEIANFHNDFIAIRSPVSISLRTIEVNKEVSKSFVSAGDIWTTEYQTVA